MTNIIHFEFLFFFHNLFKNFSVELIPKDLEKELRNVYVCTCELLSHFWRSFPPTTPALEEKAVRMHEALHRFHSARLKPFEVRRYPTLL